MDVVTSV